MAVKPVTFSLSADKKDKEKVNTKQRAIRLRVAFSFRSNTKLQDV
jgi:hypothetical protein